MLRVVGKSYAGKKTVLIQRERKNTPIFKEIKISVHIQGALFSNLKVFIFHNWLHIKCFKYLSSFLINFT